MKKEWKKPQLIVVVRGSAEENVLNACKEMGMGGAQSAHTQCALELCIDSCEVYSFS